MSLPTGDPLIRFMYLSVALVITLFKSCIGKVIIITLVNLACWHGWHLPWDFYFYKMHSPTPLIFTFYGFLDMSKPDCLRFSRFCCARCCLGFPYLHQFPPSVNSIYMGCLIFQAYLLGALFRVLITCTHLYGGFNCAPLAARLLVA